MRTKVKTEQLMGLIQGKICNVVLTCVVQNWYFKQRLRKMCLKGVEKLLFITTLSPAYLPQGAPWSCQNLWGNIRRGDETKNISENVAVGCWEAALRESALKHSPQPSSEHLQTPLWFRKSAVVHCAWNGSHIKQEAAFFQTSSTQRVGVSYVLRFVE